MAANAISQDGDALFPLLVRHKAASLWATVHTTIPAIIAGIVRMAGAVLYVEQVCGVLANYGRLKHHLDDSLRLRLQEKPT